MCTERQSAIDAGLSLRLQSRFLNSIRYDRFFHIFYCFVGLAFMYLPHIVSMQTISCPIQAGAEINKSILQSLKLETKDFARVLEYVDEDTLLILDIDHTLIHQKTCFGSVDWFSRASKELIARGLNAYEAYLQLYPLAIQTQKIVEVELVDTHILEILNQIKAKNPLILALTKRPLFLAEETLLHLDAVGIDLSQNPLSALTIPFPKDVCFRGGVIFIGDFNDKGEILQQLLIASQQEGHRFNKVVLIDDLESNIHSVEEASLKNGLHYVGLRYGADDVYRQAFDGKIADIQKNLFQHILPESLVKELLKTSIGQKYLSVCKSCSRLPPQADQFLIQTEIALFQSFFLDQILPNELAEAILQIEEGN